MRQVCRDRAAAHGPACGRERHSFLRRLYIAYASGVEYRVISARFGVPLDCVAALIEEYCRDHKAEAEAVALRYGREFGYLV